MGFLKSILGFFWNLLCLVPRFLWIIFTSPRWIFTKWQRPSLWGSRKADQKETYHVVIFLPVFGVATNKLKKEFHNIFGKGCESIVSEFDGLSVAKIFKGPHLRSAVPCYSFDQYMQTCCTSDSIALVGNTFVLKGEDTMKALEESKLFELLWCHERTNVALAHRAKGDIKQFWDEHAEQYINQQWGEGRECWECDSLLAETLTAEGKCSDCGCQFVDHKPFVESFAGYLIDHELIKL